MSSAFVHRVAGQAASQGAPHPDRVRLRLRVRGAVQGVGFRPFVHRLARELHLAGWVRNGPAGVVVEAEGDQGRLEALRQRLSAEAPPRASIHGLEPFWLDPVGFEDFRILPSDEEGPHRAVVLPDIATCGACRREIFDPAERRSRYPFTNCTDCGPRYTIIDSLPYDRPRTAMAGFAMCRRCRAEYEDPADRRFHAQPIACPDCGPQLALWDRYGRVRARRDEALGAAVEALARGAVVAVKGLGGFHLMVDAADGTAVERLRRAKARDQKPFALLYSDLDSVRRDCRVGEVEAGLLTSPEAPIVLLARRGRPPGIDAAVAPGNPLLGVMLPCTPLHHLLLADFGRPLVATSGNLAEEPICIDEHEAVRRLGGVADLLLVHDRPIRRHADDSIVRLAAGRELVLRRGRGYAPFPLPVPDARAAVAFGGQVKNAVAVAAAGQVFLGQHVGDLGNAAARDVAEALVDDLARLYEVTDPVLVCDLHPDYEATRNARRRGRARDARVVAVQHHHAHVRACMAENEIEAPVLGVSWDGTGYGPDRTVWGGEFLLVSPSGDAPAGDVPRGGCRRVGHLRPFRLPGGEAAVREPRRSALGLLHALGGRARWDGELPPVAACSPEELRVFDRVLDAGVRAPLTTSAGRLFDGVAALAGLRQRSGFEGQAAMELEFAARRCTAAGAPRYRLPLQSDAGAVIVDWGPALQAIVSDLCAGAGVTLVARCFHEALARAIVAVARRIGVERVALTGGCFQNALLTELAVAGLRAAGLCPYWHQRVPPNDGGLALGQIAAAAADGQLAPVPASSVTGRPGPVQDPPALARS